MFVSGISHTDTQQRNYRRNPEFRNAVSVGYIFAEVGSTIGVTAKYFCFKNICRMEMHLGFVTEPQLVTTFC